MKFLICGLGSIGQRHVRTLRRLLGEQAEIECFRARKLDVLVDDQQQAIFGTSPEAHFGLMAHGSLDLALANRPDIVFVTNPSSMHVDTALTAARAGCHVFIEKPVGNTMAQVAALTDVVKQNGLVAAVGYQLRFHPALNAVKNVLAEGTIGRIVSAQIHFGEGLPGMHPYEDYRTSHAARADQGGGVILCLSHEVDYACWLFGRPQSVHCVGGHLSDLEMDGVEDTAQILMEYRDGARSVPVSVYLDFIQRPPRRTCSIVGEYGQIHWDYYENVVRAFGRTPGEAKEIAFTSFQRNDMFDAQAANVVEAVKGSEELVSPLADGVSTLEVCLAARQSMADRRPVQVGEG